MATKKAHDGVGLSTPRASSPRALLFAFHLSSRDPDLLQWHRLALLDWPVDEIEERMLTYITASLMIGTGRRREPILFRVGRVALTAYGRALSQPDRERFRVLVGAGLAALTEILAGLQLEGPRGRRWTPTSGTPLSTWFETVGSLDLVRVVSDPSTSDTVILQAQLVRRCIPPVLRKVLWSR